MGITRMCGQRVCGAAYLVCHLSDHGMPVEYFLVDPPLVVDREDLGISPVGVKLVEKNGVWHVLDWVGSSFYPNVADFVEELKQFGLSRRVPKTISFSKLTKDSKIILLHERASIRNHKDYNIHGRSCPKSIPGHDEYREMCVKVWWNDIEGGEELPDGKVVIKMPSFSYQGYARPTPVVPEYELAIFCALPIQGIEVIDDPEYGTHDDAMQRASVSEITVNLVEE